MAIKVIHRPDQLLQENVAIGCEPHQKGTFIDEVTIPTHRAIVAFLDAKVVGQTFADQASLEKVLNTWPGFAVTEGDLKSLDPAFARMAISDRGTVAMFEGAHGPLDVGLIQAA